MTRSFGSPAASRAGFLFFVLVAWALLGATTAAAQAVDIPAVLEAEAKAPPTLAIVQYGHQFAADVEDGGGTEHARDTAFFGLGHRIALGEHTTFFAIGNYTLHAYDFSGGRAANNRYQWDRVHRGVLAGLIGHELDAHWRIVGGGLVRTWGETGAEFDETLTGGLLAGVSYQASEDLSVGVLIGAISKLEGGVGLIPVPTVKWKVSDALRLDVGMVQLVDPGVGAQLTYQITPELAFGSGFTFQNRQFRLSGQRRASATDPGRNRTDDGGVGQETEIPIFATLRFRPVPQVELDLNGGIALGGNLRVEDEDGGRLADDDYDPAGLLAVKAQFFF